MINKFEKLETWIKANNLVIFIYTVTDNFPKSELFALTSQTTRAAVSIPANIAEGCSRSSAKDLGHFLEIAIGSAFELKTLIGIAFARDYIPEQLKTKVDHDIETTVKLIYGFKRSLKLWTTHHQPSATNGF